jgi:hypothetical protein
MGKELFEKRVIEEDTRILSTTYLNQDGYDLLVEQWFWDGIKAKSLIFISDKIKDQSDLEVENLARKILQLPDDKSATLKRKADFTFFNFDFKC